MSLTTTFAVLSGLLLLSRLIWNIYLYPYFFSQYRSLPQAKQPRTWHGVTLSLLHNGHTVLEYIDNTPNKGSFRVLDLFNSEALVVTDPEWIRDILQTNAYNYCKVANVQNFMRVLLGDGLVTVDGDEHKRQRKAMNPAFSFRHVQELYPVFWAKASEMIDCIREEMNFQDSSRGVDITSWVDRAALDIIGIAALGVNFDALTDPTNKLSRAYQDIFEPDSTSAIIFLLSVMVSPIAVKILPFKKAREIREGSAFVKQYIKETIEARERKADKKTTHEQNDILSVASKYGSLNADELVDQARTLLAAGHETTATGVQWALFTLTRPENLSVQQRLREEIHKRLPRPASGEQMTAQLLDSLTFLDAVCKECLRLNTPSPFSRRTSVRDTVLRGVPIRKGTQLILPNWAINKSRALWGDNAKDFNPDRWLKGEHSLTGGADALAFQTFSYGARACVGKSFAMAEMKAILAALVGTFEITKTEDEKPVKTDWGVIARIFDGFSVVLKPAKGW